MSKLIACLISAFLPAVALGVVVDFTPQPPYPASAFVKKIQGRVVVAITFNKAGQAVKVTVAQSSGSELLDAWSVHWIKEHWSLSPKTIVRLGGEGGALQARVPIFYILDRNRKEEDEGPSKERYPAFHAYQDRMNSEIETHWNNLSVSRWKRGTISVRLTVHSDGTVLATPLNPPPSSATLSTAVALRSIADLAPFEIFPPEVKKEVAEIEGNDGSSFSEEFRFTIP